MRRRKKEDGGRGEEEKKRKEIESERDHRCWIQPMGVCDVLKSHSVHLAVLSCVGCFGQSMPKQGGGWQPIYM